MRDDKEAWVTESFRSAARESRIMLVIVTILVGVGLVEFTLQITASISTGGALIAQPQNVH